MQVLLNNYDIYKICKQYKIAYIEDACHAIGTKYYHNNKNYYIGSNKHSDLTIFSFHAVKNITTGEGLYFANQNYMMSY